MSLLFTVRVLMELDIFLVVLIFFGSGLFSLRFC